MSQHNQHFVTEQMTAELRYLHKVMQAIDILGEQPALHVVAYGKIWRYADLLHTAVRYAQLAELHGFDTSPFKQWFNRDLALFQLHGVELRVS
ncbi:hypothetical protein ORJ00_10695 [Rheinheimera baltica]|uniref:hypothetical protein n=1 Tax=Rheinheimera baltica TaxID=67576 RepID=UPI00273D36BA|nr:hypothetical protein [Rheinheimera baltica]MDP5143213.1 hypothetical protein [Rheinheimera baltica]